MKQSSKKTEQSNKTNKLTSMGLTVLIRTINNQLAKLAKTGFEVTLQVAMCLHDLQLDKKFKTECPTKAIKESWYPDNIGLSYTHVSKYLRFIKYWELVTDKVRSEVQTNYKGLDASVKYLKDTVNENAEAIQSGTEVKESKAENKRAEKKQITITANKPSNIVDALNLIPSEVRALVDKIADEAKGVGYADLTNIVDALPKFQVEMEEAIAYAMQQISYKVKA